MYLIATFPIGLDIDNCTEFFANAKANTLAKVRDMYENTCLRGHLILRIIDVVEMSDCIMKSADCAYKGSMSVIVRALVVSYRPRDIIAGAKVSPTTVRETLVLRSKHADVILPQTPETNVITSGALTILTAVNVMATPRSSHIAINSTLYDPPSKTVYYQVSSDNHPVSQQAKYVPISKVAESLQNYSGEGITLMDAAIDARNYLQTVFGRTDKRIIAIVRALFSSDQKPDPVLEKATATDLLAPTRPRGKFIVVSAGDNSLDGRIYVCDEVEPTWEHEDLIKAEHEIISTLLKRYIDLCLAATIMATEFSDREKLENSKSVITIMALRKKRAQKQP